MAGRAVVCRGLGGGAKTTCLRACLHNTVTVFGAGLPTPPTARPKVARHNGLRREGTVGKPRPNGVFARFEDTL